MKYLTKTWYMDAQLETLCSDLSAREGASSLDDEFYDALYAEKERQYFDNERAIYDEDPRSLYESSDFFKDEAAILIQRTPEEERWIREQIEAFDHRPPFDEKEHKDLFKSIVKACEETLAAFPESIRERIADPRVYALGVVSPEVFNLLQAYCDEASRHTEDNWSAYDKAMMTQEIEPSLREAWGFHDCMITQVNKGDDLQLQLNSQSGFTEASSVVFKSVQVRLEEPLVGNYWIYDELYREGDLYEVHILSDGEQGLKELILTCKAIEIEE